MLTSELLTYSTVLIKCPLRSGGTSLGTGFIMHLCADSDKCIPVLITNKHVIQDAIYNEFEFCKCNSDSTPNDRDVELIRQTDQNEWILHPDEHIDLCCLPIGKHINRLANSKGLTIYYRALSLDLIPSQKEIDDFSALEDIVMVGYPIGLSDTHNHKPILRKGVTATHIKNDYKGEKKFLIDAACYQGSSGSPVFICNEGAFTKKDSLIVGGRLKFIGVLYATPIFNAQGDFVFANLPTTPRILTQLPINLGLVIKSSEILAFEPMLEKIF